MPELPTGTVTYLFSDMQGSTRLASALAERWPPILDRHHELIREAVTAAGGLVVSTEGDGAFAVFRTPSTALAAAVAIQRAMAAEAWPEPVRVLVRIGLHTGEAVLAADGYAGVAVHRAARIGAAGSGGQVVVSDATRALVTDGLPDGVELRSLGVHRLRDLDDPQPLHDLVIEGLPSSFGPLRTVAEPTAHLPRPLTRFLGREPQVAEVVARLAEARLLTLTGPGGTGKTRLALEVAGRVADRYDGGAHFVDLSSVADARLVPATIAHGLELPDRGGRDPMERIADRLRTGRTLLVLDNFEQVLDAAPFVAELLAAAPGLAALVTSRTPLHVYGEREYAVPPLSVPDPRHLPALDALSQYEAVALFIERATAVRPGFAVTNENAPAVAEICVRLDGLPLAIELAAARVRLLSPQAILARLEHRLGLLAGGSRDLPERQQTLRGAIAWSHDMLDERERRLFAALSVFVGGATLPAIEALCGSSDEVFEALGSLVDKSLVRQHEGNDGEPRFGMLETIREFAAERLAEDPRAADLATRHAELVTHFVDEARDRLVAADSGAWLDRLEAEHGNVRAALSWAIEARRADLALRIVAAVWRFWQRRGYLVEGLTRAEEAIAVPGADAHEDLLLPALSATGGLAYWLGNQPRATAHYERLVELARRRGDPLTEAEARYSLVFTHLYAPERSADMHAAARAAADRALDIYRSLGDRHGVAKALWAKANVEYDAGDHAASRYFALEALRALEGVDDAFLRAWANYTAGISHLLEGDAAGSLPWLKRALGTFTEAADVSGYTLVFDALAMATWKAGDGHRAAWLGGAVAALERSTGTGLNPRNRELLGWDPAQLRDDPATAAAWRDGEAASLPQLIDAALAL